MRQSKPKRLLTLKRQTIRALDTTRLQGVVGGTVVGFGKSARCGTGSCRISCTGGCLPDDISL